MTVEHNDIDTTSSNRRTGSGIAMVARCGRPNVVPDTAKGTEAAQIAVRYLGCYETDLERRGVTEAGVDTEKCCANFVSAMLRLAGAIDWHTNGVTDLHNRLRAAGWVEVDRVAAAAGDVWIRDEGWGNAQHTELVASTAGGHVVLIGSNNYPDPDNQRVNYDSTSAYITGSYILAPGR